MKTISHTSRAVCRRCLGHSTIVAALLAAAVSGCTAPTRLMFQSDPAGAMIRVDGQNVGTVPVSHEVDFVSKHIAVVEAVKPGFYPEQVTLERLSPGVRKGLINLVLMEDEAWNETTQSEVTNTWLRVQCDEPLDERSAWQKLVDSVTSRFSSLEQMDNGSGYIRTVYEVRTFRRRQGRYKIRTRFLCSMSSRQPLVYKFRIEAEQSGDGVNWEPYDRVFRPDAALIEELQSRLGVK